MLVLRRNRWATIGLVGLLSVSSASAFGTTATVEKEPIIVEGASVPERDGAEILRLGLFRWDATTGEFVPIPFQIDERVDHTFSPGTEYEFTQNIHDVFDEEDRTLDGDDEIVFLFEDAGERAPAESLGPVGADSMRHEIEVNDVTGEVNEPRYVYLFGGEGLPISPEARIQWVAGSATNVTTETFSLEFADRWLLVGYRVLPPCGDGGDLIDRVKGRAGLAIAQSESEEVWNFNAIFMGGIVGPIRALRYIRGAASGVNTIHHDTVYPGLWERDIRLRVHNLSSIWLYLDWLPGRVDTSFTPRQPAGVAIDGSPDTDPGTSVVPWEVVRGDNGGVSVLWDVRPHPLVGAIERYSVDDSDLDDEPISSPFGYTDDDDVAIGNHGIRLGSIGEAELGDGVPVRIRAYPLCGGIGDAAMGETFSALWLNPPTIRVTPQIGEVSPVRSLDVRRTPTDVVLDWETVVGASSYRVYSSDDPSLPIESWTFEAETTSTTFVDALAVLDPGTRFYAVGVVDDQGGEIF